MQRKVFASLAATAVTLSACGTATMPMPRTPGTGAGLYATTPAKAGAAKWTVLVHLAADNNLYDFGVEDLNEMEAGLTAKDVNVIVLFDGEVKGDSAIYQVVHDPKGKTNAAYTSKKLNDGGAVIPASNEIDSGDLQTNVKFAKWAVGKFPAERYAEFFWDHGSGIFRKNRSLITKGFGWDDNGSNMETKDIRTLLSATSQAAGKPVETYGFDACLMAHVELAYQAKGLANYLVASEELEPGAGWDYQAWLKGLSANPGMNGAQLGKVMVDTYIASYKAGGSQNPGGNAADATLSAVNINALVGGFVPALNKFATTLANAYPANKAALDETRNKTATFDNTDCADMGHFLTRVGESTLPAAIKAEAAAVQTELNKAVVAHGECGAPGMLDGTGLVIYFPRPDQSYNQVYGNPANIAFGAENWKSYLIASHKTIRR